MGEQVIGSSSNTNKTTSPPTAIKMTIIVTASCPGVPRHER
jgi:hypothetical protein